MEKVFGFVKRLDKCCSVDAFVVVVVEGFAFWSLLLLLDDDMVCLIDSLSLSYYRTKCDVSAEI